jgi:glucosamine--fructose-6-phosphate aminotransferase (isomerizing)
MTAFIDDCRFTLELLDRWSGPWPELVDALRAGPPVLLVAEGSSRLMPGGFAQVLARRLGLHGRLSCCGGREAQRLDLATVRVLLASNSGRSREPMAAGSKLKPLALVGVAGGPMTALGGPTRVLLPRPEVAIAATASVYAQVLTVAEAVCAAAGGAVPLDRLRRGAAAALVPVTQGAAKRLFWCGGEDGLADELALKTAETTGLPGFSCPGTMALHGVEELWMEGDLVIDLGLGAEDAADLARRAAATPARVQRVAALAEDDWAPLDRLCAGWMLLAALAAVVGRDPAVPRRARKVGNPA